MHNINYETNHSHTRRTFRSKILTRLVLISKSFFIEKSSISHPSLHTNKTRPDNL